MLIMCALLKVIDERSVLGKNFRIFGTFEEPLFLAKDVAEWIEHTNITMMLGGIDEDEKVIITPKQSLGMFTANKSYNFITEDGLYEVLMQSRKPIAKEFKKQVKEILRTIRKTGGFVAESQENRIKRRNLLRGGANLTLFNTSHLPGSTHLQASFFIRWNAL